MGVVVMDYACVSSSLTHLLLILRIFFPYSWCLLSTQPHYLSSFRSASACLFETSKLLTRSLVRLIGADNCTTVAQSRGQGFTSNTGDRTNSTRQTVPLVEESPIISFFFFNVSLLSLTKLSGVIVAYNMNVDYINQSLFVQHISHKINREKLQVIHTLKHMLEACE